jgi:hypothetical protein
VLPYLDFQFFLLQAPVVISNKKGWGETMIKLMTSPMAFVWVIAILILLFIMSRFNNKLEINSVNRAITISRSLVGVFMWFFVAPIVGFLFMNLFAIVNGIDMINASFIFQWIGLTFSSYWWLVKCFFGAESIGGQKDAYTLDAVVRILWVAIPLAFIWIRSTKTMITRLLIIPLILAFFIMARHKKAEPSFITEKEGREFFEKLPVIGNLLKEPAPVAGSKNLKKTTRAENMKNIVIFSVLGVFIVVGIGIGLYKQMYVIGLISAIIGIFGLFLLAPSGDMKILKLQHDDNHPINANIDSLIARMDSIFKEQGGSTEVYELSQQIDAALHAQHEMVKFPDSILCAPQYRPYFYDWCQN